MNPITLIRPSMPGGPGGPEDKRAEHQSARADLLRDRADDRIKEWLEAHVDSERLRLWGAADTSANPLAAYSLQASTPGLYVTPPRVRGPAGSEPFVGSRGLLAESGLWVRKQRAMYYALGLNCMLVRIGAVPSAKRLSFRLVFPHDVHVVAHSEDPTLPVEIRELRVRAWRMGGQDMLAYVWDAWSIADPDRPYFAVHRAELNGELGEDITSDAVPSLASKPWTGAGYPFRGRDEMPVLPWAIDRAIDDGTMLPWEPGRGAFRGSLNSMLNWSFAQHSARDASGSTSFMIDGVPVGAKVLVDAAGRPVSTITTQPGTTMRWNTREGSTHQAKLQSVGPGANLEMLLTYAQAYELNQLVRLGINPTDITRTNNTPTTGAAIYLSNGVKRELQRKLAPLFRRADQDTIRAAAAVARHYRLGDWPDDGYSVTYASIRLAPQEEASLREQLDWMVEHGLISEVDRYLELFPGSTEEDAVEALARAEIERLVIRRRTEQLAAERGLTLPGSAPPPPPPPPDPAASAA